MGNQTIDPIATKLHQEARELGQSGKYDLSISKLEEAIKIGHTILSKGGASLEAVTATINIMEDSPLFNAGKGAVFTHEETNELDASIMDGATLNAGAVSGVKHIKNPIDLALSVMNDSPHVMLSGEGAEEFAREQGFKMTDPSYFYTEKRMQSLYKVKERELRRHYKSLSFEDPFIKDSKFGTVGCVALDKNGNLAAGTSTGGMTNKRYGRIGDVPVIGAGTYAENDVCGISSTGHGEFFIRNVVAHDIAARMKYAGHSIEKASIEVIAALKEKGGSGGVIGLDSQGHVVMAFNTPGMFRGYITLDGSPVVAIYAED